MEALRLNDNERTLFEELFQICDLAKTAKIPKVLVGELLATSRLTTDVLLNIADLCGASRLGYFGRSQFYIALKLIAAAQNNFPISLDSFANNLPLPVFNTNGLTAKLATYDPALCSIQPDNPSQNVMPTPPPTAILNMAGGVLPPPPTKKHVRNISGPHVPQPSTGPVIQHQVGANVPTPNNLSQSSSGWASFPQQSGIDNPALVTQTSRNGTDNSNRAQTPTDSTPGDAPHPGLNSFDGSKRSFTYDTVSMSSMEYATSEAESVDDFWSITEEQRSYYVNQFLTLQPNIKDTIKGPKAKEFFEKSRLKTTELSHIWKLSDVNKDGELTLEEFCTAMHLVVLRKNEIELPTTLPPSLLPYMPASSEPFGSDLPGHGEQDSIRSASPPTLTEPAVVSSGTMWPSTTGAPALDTQVSVVSNSTVGWKDSQSSSPVQAQWTGSSIASKNIVSFDAQPPFSDQEVLHPVAVKMSPTHIMDDLEPGARVSSASILQRNRASTDAGIVTLSSISGGGPIQGRPRPTPKKAQSTPVPSEQQTAGTNQQQSTSVGGPPRVPPRHWSNSPGDADPFSPSPGPSPGAPWDGNLSFPTNFSTEFPTDDFKQPEFNIGFSEGDISVPFTLDGKAALAPARPAAEEPPRINHQYTLRDKREIQLSIKQQRERNDALVRVNSELNQELQEVMEQRISLEIQLEHIKPC